MAFLSAWSVQKEAIDAQGDTAKEDGILFATDTAKAKKSDNTVHYVRIRIGSTAATKAKLEPGMLAVLQYDPTNGIGLITRTPDDGSKGGWKLAGLKRNAQGATPLQLRFTWHEKLPSIASPALGTEVHATKEGIQFTFPEGTSFDKLAAKEDSGVLQTQYRRRSTDRIKNFSRNAQQ